MLLPHKILQRNRYIFKRLFTSRARKKFHAQVEAQFSRTTGNAMFTHVGREVHLLLDLERESLLFLHRQLLVPDSLLEPVDPGSGDDGSLSFPRVLQPTENNPFRITRGKTRIYTSRFRADGQVCLSPPPAQNPRSAVKTGIVTPPTSKSLQTPARPPQNRMSLTLSFVSLILI